MPRVDPTQVGKALDAALLRARLAVLNASYDPVFGAAKRAAGAARLAAARMGAPVAIRVSKNNGKVSIVVTGPGAPKVNALIRQQLDTLLPEAAEAVKDEIIRNAQ